MKRTSIILTSFNFLLPLQKITLLVPLIPTAQKAVTILKSSSTGIFINNFQHLPEILLGSFMTQNSAIFF